MYNLSPRMGIALESQTPSNVGPSTYIICDSHDTRVNVRPFSSTEKRVSKYFGKIYCEKLYKVPDFTHNIKGVPSLKYKAKRFVYKESDTPGPATYDLNDSTSKSKANSKCHGKGRLYLCKVPYTLSSSAPTIPTKIDENGYFLDEGRNIIKIPPNEHDTTLGPAYYKVTPVNSCFGCESYRGCKWSASKTKRSTKQTSGNPGPGSYDLETTVSPRQVRDDKYREMARLFSFLPRFLDQQELQTVREGLPGPGYYNNTSGTIKVKPSLSVNPRPFVSGSKRFRSEIPEGPAPGEYEIKSIPKQSVSLKDTPFGVQASRFEKRKIQETPGPAEYSLKSPMMAKFECKSGRYSTFHPPFCTTSERNTIGISKDAALSPSPADYTVETGGARCKRNSSSVFNSKVNRFPRRCQSAQASAASYNITPQFNAMRSPISHNRANISFNAAAPRKQDIIPDNPGPAKYVHQDSSLNQKGYIIPYSQRFKDVRDELPGPGTYLIHPNVSDSISVAYKTHNLRIKEAVFRRKLRLAPKETWDKWVATLGQKKKLAWFL